MTDIVLFVDAPNWSNDRIACAIKKYGTDEDHKIHVMYQKNFELNDKERHILENCNVIHHLGGDGILILKNKKYPLKRHYNITTIASRRIFNYNFDSDYFKLPDCLICVSKRLVNVYKDMKGKKIKHVPNGVNTNLFTPDVHIQKEFVGHISSLNMWKGFELIKHACVATGDQILTPKLSLKRPERDAIPHSELVNFYRRMFVYVCASDETEGFGLPIVEALACGIPVVSTAVGIADEIVRSGWNGFLVRRTIEDIRDHIRIIKTWDRDEEMAIKIRKSVAQYDWTIIVEKLKRIYDGGIDG